MKHFYLIIAALISVSSFAGTVHPPKTKTTFPSIGVKLEPMGGGGGTLFFNIAIKNLGDEPLTDITISNDMGIIIFDNQTWGDTIPNLAPGEEILYAFNAQKNYMCF